MDNFLLIDFNDFSPPQICSFVVERVHSKIQEKLLYLNNVILSNSIQKMVYATTFHTVYVALVDKINQLIQLEQKVLFSLVVQQSESNIPIQVPTKSKGLIKQFQHDIKSALLRCRTLFQDLEQDASYHTLTSIIELELLNVEHLITQWFYVVNKNILTTTSVGK